MLLTPQIEYFLKKNSVTLTDHGNALCSSVVLLLCYPCDKCHGFYNAKSAKNKKASQFPWEWSWQCLKHLFPFIYKRCFIWLWNIFFHSFILLVVWTIGQRWYSLNPPKQFPLICSTPSPHGYKFIFKWFVWVQLLKWWVKFFLYGKDPTENIFCHSFIWLVMWISCYPLNRPKPFDLIYSTSLTSIYIFFPSGLCRFNY